MPEGDGVPLFAAVKTFHAEGKDMLSAVSQLLLASIDNDTSIDHIIEKFQSDYRVTGVPKDAIKTVLSRLKKEGFIQYNSLQKVQLTETGTTHKIRLSESIAALDRDLNDLIEDMSRYFVERNYQPLKNSSRALIEFIDRNMALTSAVLTRSSKKQLDAESKIAEYILHIEKNDTRHYALLQNMFFGRLYLSVMRVRSDFAKNTKLEQMDVYLDTSILMSCLGLHDEESTRQASDLLKIIISHEKMRVVVAEETVDEARRVLNSASTQQGRYISGMPVRSIYFQLHKRGYDKDRIQLLVETLEERIEKLGIAIVYIVVDRDSIKYKDTASEISTWASLLDHPKRPSTLDHDAALLCHIKNLRNHTHSRIFEKNRAIFTSPDSAIVNYAKEQSKTHNSFPLSITPIELTSLLWLRDVGSEDIASNIMRQSIMAYVRERAISQSLWEKFVGELEKAIDDDKISEEDVGIILASSETFEILATHEKNATKAIINKEFIHNLVNTQNATSISAEVAEAKVQSVLEVLANISNVFAILASIILWGIPLVLLAIIFTWLISFTELDLIVNIATVILFTFGFAAILILGKPVKLFDVLIRLRVYLYNALHTFCFNRLIKLMGIDEKTSEHS